MTPIVFLAFALAILSFEIASARADKRLSRHFAARGPRRLRRGLGGVFPAAHRALRVHREHCLSLFAETELLLVWFLVVGVLLMTTPRSGPVERG